MRRMGLLLILTTLLSGCAALNNLLAPTTNGSESAPSVVAPGSEAAPLPTGPKAPAIENDVWLNSKPLTQAYLDGKVVLIDFWTFG